MFPEKKTELRVEMIRDPHPATVFKISYEFLFLENLHTSRLLKNMPKCRFC